MKDCIIIGAGPAGLTAAIYAARAGHTVQVFEELIHGGQVSSTPEVENYPAIKKISGVEFAMNIYDQALSFGVEILYEKIVKVELQGRVKKVYTAKNQYDATTVIIANGAKRRMLECEGEERLKGRGVSYCATCDGAFYKDKVTAIVGGGNTALEDALFLANNCEKVYLIHRRDAFRASHILIDAVVKNPKIEIIYNSTVKAITGENSVSGVTVENKLDNQTRELDIAGIFIAVGLVPENQVFAEEITLDKTGYIVAGENCHTNVEGVFVAGDTRTKSLRQIVTAASDGAIASVEMSTYILGKS